MSTEWSEFMTEPKRCRICDRKHSGNMLDACGNGWNYNQDEAGEWHWLCPVCILMVTEGKKTYQQSTYGT